jgi:RNA polymerase sigma-70 factor (ECF subfamily)
MSPKGLITDIFLTYRARLARVVSRIVPPQDIEDIVQATYVRVCQYNAKSDIGEPQALLVSVARNLALDHVKRADYRLTTNFENDLEIETTLARDATDEAYHTVASNEEFSRFCDAVRQLPVQCRRVFVLKKVYGYSQREIAEELGLAESTVEKHIATGMHHCIRYLKDQTAKDGPAKKRQRVASAHRGRP